MVATALKKTHSRGATDPAATTAIGPAGAKRESEIDANLVRRFNAGDESAFVEIATRYRKKLFSVGYRHLRNSADAEEIAQDALVRAHKGLINFRGDSSLSTWIHRIAFNLARNRHKHDFIRRRHLTVSVDASINAESEGTFLDVIASDAPNPARLATSAEFSKVVVTCMEQLGDSHREILTMRNVQSCSYSQIAKTLGIRTGTVKSRIGRARESLRSLLAVSYPEFVDSHSQFEWIEPIRSVGFVAIA